MVYKIVSGCIAQRMKYKLPFIINPDQTGFMTDRFLGHNILLAYDVLSEANTIHKKGILLRINFEKASDSVSWSCTYKALKYFNFSDSIQNWVKLFNTEIKARVIINNTISPRFKPEQGFKQGDPISPYIFLIIGEILSHMIKQYKNIEGYKTKEIDVKIFQNANYTSLFLDGS